MSQRKSFLFFLSGFVLFFSAVISFANQYNYASLLEVLKFRNIGPAIMGGRTVDFAVVENNTSIIYAAVGPSGVWKSENNGITWSPVFDREGLTGTPQFFCLLTTEMWSTSVEISCLKPQIGDSPGKK